MKLPPKSSIGVYLVLDVGDEAVNAEDHTAVCGEEEPAYRRCKAKYA